MICHIAITINRMRIIFPGNGLHPGDMAQFDLAPVAWPLGSRVTSSKPSALWLLPACLHPRVQAEAIRDLGIRRSMIYPDTSSTAGDDNSVMTGQAQSPRRRLREEPGRPLHARARWPRSAPETAAQAAGAHSARARGEGRSSLGTFSRRPRTGRG